MDRRKFLKITSVATIGMGFGAMLPFRSAWAYVQSNAILKFQTPLRRVGQDIPIMNPDATPGFDGATHYTIDVRQFEDSIYRGATRLWGYGQGDPKKNFRHLGGVIVAERDKAIQITFRNFLPDQHILPVDTTIPGAEGAHNRISVHLHGGFTPWVSDGGPFAWWTPDGTHGVSHIDMKPTLSGSASAPGCAEFYYPNKQSARLMWYHDHALGITRLNAYAGLASAYVITDKVEQGLVDTYGLPGPLDDRTHYLIFQDKVFVPGNIDEVDPTWKDKVKNSKPGDLWYPHVYETTRWDQDPPNPQILPDPSVVPEMFGDTILVNGTAYPYLTLDAGWHRLRLLNACNARFLNPRLVRAKATDPTEADLAAPGPTPTFTQIGTEGGFLPGPVEHVNGTGPRLLLGPAERADLLVDLSMVAPGSTLILYNDAPAPYPAGDSSTDFDVDNPDTPVAQPGLGPNTRTLLQIRVTEPAGAPEVRKLPASFALEDPFLIYQAPGVPTLAPPRAKVRRLTLNEGFDHFGRLIQLLGTDKIAGPEGFGLPYEAPATEVIREGTTEVWEIFNLTGDTHPIHFHLVNVQILNRQVFSYERVGRGKNRQFTPASVSFPAPPVPPDANELGWKETVRMNPGEVTRVMIRFNLPAVGFTVPPSPRTGDNEYVWHCHILEHEEHDMMRPLIIT